MGDNWKTTFARQMRDNSTGDKWEATSERQVGNNGVANGRHLETSGNLIPEDFLEDKWELWRQSEDNWKTTSGRHLGDNW